MLLALVRQSQLFTRFPAVMFLILAATGNVLAQQPPKEGTKQNVEDPYHNLQRDIYRYETGEMQPTGENDMQAKEAAAAAAKWFVYRLTWWDKLENDREYTLNILKVFDSDFMSNATRPENAARNKVFMKLFNQEMITALKLLLSKDFATYKSAQIQAGVLLSSLARNGDESFGNYLVELLKDAKAHDALKVHVVKALRAFFAASPPFLDVDAQKVKPEDAARVDAVIAFVLRPAPKDLSPEELEAFRFIRREAIRALAQSRIPAEVVDKTGVKTPVALVLMKMLAPEKNGITPPTSLSEKLEAAIGLCRMNLKLDKYQPEATVYLVGKCLTEFAAKYREDEPNLKGGDRPPLMPWKYYATRLEQALQDMSTATEGNLNQNLKTLLDNSRGILKKIHDHGQVGDGDITVLVGALTKMWPQAPALTPYQGVPTSQIQMPSAKQD